MDLRALAEFNLNFAATMLQSGRQLAPMATVFDEAGHMNVLTQGSPDIEQEIFMQSVRKMVKDFNAQAVCLVADSYITHVDSEEAKHRMALGEVFTAEELVTRKWGRRRDAIVCTVQTRKDVAVFHQFYRMEKGKIILEECSEGNPELTTFGNTGGSYRLFEQPAPTVQ